MDDRNELLNDLLEALRLASRTDMVEVIHSLAASKLTNDEIANLIGEFVNP